MTDAEEATRRLLLRRGFQPTRALTAGYHPRHSLAGIAWTAITAITARKARTGPALGNPVLSTEGRVTLIVGILAGNSQLSVVQARVADGNIEVLLPQAG